MLSRSLPELADTCRNSATWENLAEVRPMHGRAAQHRHSSWFYRQARNTCSARVQRLVSECSSQACSRHPPCRCFRHLWEQGDWVRVIAWPLLWLPRRSSIASRRHRRSLVSRGRSQKPPSPPAVPELGASASSRWCLMHRRDSAAPLPLRGSSTTLPDECRRHRLINWPASVEEWGRHAARRNSVRGARASRAVHSGQELCMRTCSAPQRPRAEAQGVDGVRQFPKRLPEAPCSGSWCKNAPDASFLVGMVHSRQTLRPSALDSPSLLWPAVLSFAQCGPVSPRACFASALCPEIRPTPKHVYAPLCSSLVDCFRAGPLLKSKAHFVYVCFIL